MNRPRAGLRIERRYSVLLLVTAAVIGLDQFTKHLIDRNFGLFESRTVIPGFFNLTYIRNLGAAFGIMRDTSARIRVPFFLVVPVAALFAITYVFRKVPKEDSRLLYGLSLVMGGALGNLIDRVFQGAVVDFLDFHWKYAYHFPAFNVADSAICVGVGLLLLDVFLEPEAKIRRTKKRGLRANASASR